MFSIEYLCYPPYYPPPPPNPNYYPGGGGATPHSHPHQLDQLGNSRVDIDPTTNEEDVEEVVEGVVIGAKK